MPHGGLGPTRDDVGTRVIALAGKEREMLTAKEAASRLNGNQYRNEGPKELWAEMKSAGLVAVFGASDDLMEIRGAANDEIGAYDGGEARFNRRGLFERRCQDDDCPHEKDARSKCAAVHARWCAEEGISWTYVTGIPHETFLIMEDEDIYCRGIVFALADVP